MEKVGGGDQCKNGGGGEEKEALFPAIVQSHGAGGRHRGAENPAGAKERWESEKFLKIF